MNNRFFVTTMKKEKTVRKKNRKKSNAKHMQTHVVNIHLRKTITRRGISRCGSERIAEEEEEIEKNMKELSSAKSATFSRVRFRQTSLSRTQSKDYYKSFRALSKACAFQRQNRLVVLCGVFCLSKRHKKIRNENII